MNQSKKLSTEMVRMEGIYIMWQNLQKTDMELVCLHDNVNSEELKNWEHKQNNNKTPENGPLISCAHPFGYTNTEEKKQLVE